MSKHHINPLIQDQPRDTIEHCRSVLWYLSNLEGDHNTGMAEDEDERFGRSLVLDTIRAALREASEALSRPADKPQEVETVWPSQAGAISETSLKLSTACWGIERQLTELNKRVQTLIRVSPSDEPEPNVSEEVISCLGEIDRELNGALGLARGLREFATKNGKASEAP